MLNSNKIENLINEIKILINNSEIFDENCIFDYAKNYAKDHKIEIGKGEIKSIIYNIINQIKNSEIHYNIGDSTYTKNEIKLEKTPLKELFNSIENDFLI